MEKVLFVPTVYIKLGVDFLAPELY